MPNELTYEGTLTVLTCWCGMRHAVPSELRDFQQRQHANGKDVTAVYCPLGHSHVPSGKGKAALLAEKLEAERQRSASLVSRLDQETAALRSTKGQLTKARKRIENGVCPCCHRSFVQLARHMKTKHPDFDASA